jgi:predicted O-methyltransferase YrrM
MAVPLLAGWTRQASRSTLRDYYFQASTGRSLWCDATLPAGWGTSQTDAAAPLVYVHMATGEERSSPPASPPLPHLAAAAAAGLPQPSAVNVSFDGFSPDFKARNAGGWLVQQLAGAAQAELAWWAAARDGAPRPADASAEAAGEALQGAAGAAAADACAAPLIAAALAALGEAAFVRAWDARAKRFVLRRDAVAAAGGSSGQKRPRDESSSSSAAAPGAGSAAVAATAALTFRPAAAFPRLAGAALYTSAAFHSSPTIADIYTSGRVTTAAGDVRKISAAVGPKESRHLYFTVRDNGLQRALEVGCANGLSALAICQALEDGGAPPTAQLTSIDPFQTTQWASTALANLARAGLAHRHRLVEEKSYAALPRLLREVRDGGAPLYDAVFVDGMHLFDYTLVDMFYADLLLRVGGVLLVDDARHRGVAPAVDFAKNWPHFRYVADTVCADTLATFVKVGHDAREWDHFAPFASSKGAAS